MRVAFFNENGVEHMTALSFDAIEKIQEKYKDFTKLDAVLAKGTLAEQFKMCAEVLVILMQSGDQYAKEFDLANPKPLTVKQLCTRCSIEDVPAMEAAIKECFNRSTKREVKVKTDPKAATAQE